MEEEEIEVVVTTCEFGENRVKYSINMRCLDFLFSKETVSVIGLMCEGSFLVPLPVFIDFDLSQVGRNLAFKAEAPTIMEFSVGNIALGKRSTGGYHRIGQYSLNLMGRDISQTSLRNTNDIKYIAEALRLEEKITNVSHKISTVISGVCRLLAIALEKDSEGLRTINLSIRFGDMDDAGQYISVRSIYSDFGCLVHLNFSDSLMVVKKFEFSNVEINQEVFYEIFGDTGASLVQTTTCRGISYKFLSKTYAEYIKEEQWNQT